MFACFLCGKRDRLAASTCGNDESSELRVIPRGGLFTLQYLCCFFLLILHLKASFSTQRRRLDQRGAWGYEERCVGVCLTETVDKCEKSKHQRCSSGPPTELNRIHLGDPTREAIARLSLPLVANDLGSSAMKNKP